MTIKLIVAVKGSAKSGNRGHAGIPGKVGGSRPKGTGIVAPTAVATPIPASVVQQSIPKPVISIALPKGAKQVMVGPMKDVESFIVKSAKPNRHVDHKSGKPLPSYDVYDKSGVLQGTVRKKEEFHNVSSWVGNISMGQKRFVKWEYGKPGTEPGGPHNMQYSTWYDVAIYKLISGQ